MEISEVYSVLSGSSEMKPFRAKIHYLQVCWGYMRYLGAFKRRQRIPITWDLEVIPSQAYEDAWGIAAALILAPAVVKH